MQEKISRKWGEEVQWNAKKEINLIEEGQREREQDDYCLNKFFNSFDSPITCEFK